MISYMNALPAEAQCLGHVYQTAQGIFCLDPRDQFVAQMLIQTNGFGGDEIARISSFLTPQSNMLLLGGHIGSLAVPLSKKVDRMTVLEANPHTYRLLSMNLVINRCANVTAYHLAANDQHGTLQFVQNIINSGGSKRLPKDQLSVYFEDQPEICTVAATKLDDLLHGQTFDLIFMDIEGSEYFAMKGMPRLLAHAQVVVCEFLPHHLTHVAGVSVDEFWSCLSDFQTMLVPSQQQVFYGTDDILQKLTSMMAQGDGDMGLIFHKQHLSVHFASN